MWSETVSVLNLSETVSFAKPQVCLRGRRGLIIVHSFLLTKKFSRPGASQNKTQINTREESAWLHHEASKHSRWRDIFLVNTVPRGFPMYLFYRWVYLFLNVEREGGAPGWDGGRECWGAVPLLKPPPLPPPPPPNSPPSYSTCFRHWCPSRAHGTHWHPRLPACHSKAQVVPPCLQENKHNRSTSRAFRRITHKTHSSNTLIDTHTPTRIKIKIKMK